MATFDSGFPIMLQCIAMHCNEPIKSCFSREVGPGHPEATNMVSGPQVDYSIHPSHPHHKPATCILNYL